jgi:hypothetical protein
MDTTNIVLLVVAVVFLGLYITRRRSRVKKNDFD